MSNMGVADAGVVHVTIPQVSDATLQGIVGCAAVGVQVRSHQDVDHDHRTMAQIMMIVLPT